MKNIIIKVREIGLVEVVSPYFISRAKIDEILRLKKDWIEQRLNELKTTKKAELLSGNFVLFLGRKYILEFDLKISKNVEIHNDKIILKCLETDENKEKLLNDFYKIQSKEIFSEILKRFCVIVGKDIKALKVRKMKTRWGSCNTKKSYINLNTELIKKDILVIEAVIMHELTHLYHANHSKAFYTTLLGFMPDYKERINLLKDK
ncbi:M48 family metallopeptidase [Campylobacter sp. RM12640]|uniref:M48 family metallopeptidase n=1 Tax=unclassified Campylobacter TaxID=2593542 RepID=UPI00301586D8|nr:M48 family metallopeptidase [Campylobacter sp. RM12640]MBZ7988278.1 M48 family metallopeptidase [Campylobacter sp. RM12635]